MRTSTFLIPIGLSSLAAAQTYVLEDDYEAASFFNMFDFFTSADPTNGYVSYVDQATAQNEGLISNNNGSIYMGVDSTNVASGSGRASVRVTSKKSYNHGLIILDLGHMPGGTCGTWPAFWMVGPTWPTNGEIDIIEGVNSATVNEMTLHTNAGCSVSNYTTPYSGTLQTPNCDVNAPGQATNAGCLINSTSSQTFGADFNAINGGVYATEWTSAAISIYFFPRSAIPADITSGNPDPSGWGQPQAIFSGGCDIDSHVVDQKIVFDTTFCGDWAGNGLFGVRLVPDGIDEHRLVHYDPLVSDADLKYDFPVHENLYDIHDSRLKHIFLLVFDHSLIHNFILIFDHSLIHNFILIFDHSLVYNLIFIRNLFLFHDLILIWCFMVRQQQLVDRFQLLVDARFSLVDARFSLVDDRTDWLADNVGLALACADEFSAGLRTLHGVRQHVEPRSAGRTEFLGQKEER